MPSSGEAVDQVGREDVAQPELVVEVGDVLDLGGVDVVRQLRARVGLERVRRVLRLQAGLEQVLRGGAGATGDGAVDELDVGVLLVEHPDQGVEAGLLGAGGPPGEDLDLFAAAPLAAVVARVAAAARGQRETETSGCRHRVA